MAILRSGRCSECRRKKRKCDELRPQCSRCQNADATCVYEDISNFVHVRPLCPEPETSCAQQTPPVRLVVRKSRRAFGSRGVFHTFSCRKEKSERDTAGGDADSTRLTMPLSRPLESAVTKLGKALVALIAQPLPHGICYSIHQVTWLSYLPARLSHSSLLEQSVACTVLAQTSLSSGADERSKDALRSYVGVIERLRCVVAKGEEMKGEIVATIKLLEIFEMSVCTAKLGWRQHAHGAVDFFVAAGPGFCSGGFEQALFLSTFGSAISKALTTGEPSVFDHEEWYAIQTPSPLDSNYYDLLDREEPQRRRRVLTMLPRFLKAMRAVLSRSRDATCVSTAIDVANKVLELDWGVWASTLPPEATVHFVEDEDGGQQIPPFVLHFPEPSYLHALAYSVRWCSRILVACLCRSLLAQGVPKPMHWPPCQAFANEERRCALFICGALSHFTTGSPHVASTVLFPLEAAWGALWRLRHVQMPDIDVWVLISWLEKRMDEYAKAMGTSITRDGLVKITQVFQGETAWIYE